MSSCSEIMKNIEKRTRHWDKLNTELCNANKRLENLVKGDNKMEINSGKKTSTVTFRIVDTDIFKLLLEANRKMIEDERIPIEYKEQIKQIVTQSNNS